MKSLTLKIAVAVAGALVVSGAFDRAVRANDDNERRFFFSTNLSTFNEVPPKATGASGTFRAKLSPDGSTLSWTFTWEGLTGPPLFAHIHFGQKGTNSQIMTFFCGGPPAGGAVPTKPDCPQSTSGSITGTTTAADIIALDQNIPNKEVDQGLPAADFAAFLQALRHGDGYANMHTPRFPGGEIRGQIRAHIGEHDNDHN